MLILNILIKLSFLEIKSCELVTRAVDTIAKRKPRSFMPPEEEILDEMLPAGFVNI